MASEEIININVGVLGHVDSGKTSFCAAISTVLSTAALDKSPQSQARGITQDLQFSAFRVPKKVPTPVLPSENKASEALTHKAASSAPVVKPVIYNITLVDCPGHASLIRTIIGGTN